MHCNETSAAATQHCGTECFKVFSSDLAHAPSLRVLDLSGNHLCMHSCANLAALALPHLSMLQNLNLGNNDLGNSGMHAVIASLHRANVLTSLDTLEATSCGLTDMRAHACNWLHEFLPHACSLRKLNLSGNEGIADGGVGALARHLPQLRALQELDVAGTGVSPAGEGRLREVQDALGGKLAVLKVLVSLLCNAGVFLIHLEACTRAQPREAAGLLVCCTL